MDKTEAVGVEPWQSLLLQKTKVTTQLVIAGSAVCFPASSYKGCFAGQPATAEVHITIQVGGCTWCCCDTSGKSQVMRVSVCKLLGAAEVLLLASLVGAWLQEAGGEVRWSGLHCSAVRCCSIAVKDPLASANPNCVEGCSGIAGEQ